MSKTIRFLLWNKFPYFYIRKTCKGFKRIKQHKIIFLSRKPFLFIEEIITKTRKETIYAILASFSGIGISLTLQVTIYDSGLIKFRMIGFFFGLFRMIGFELRTFYRFILIN